LKESVETQQKIVDKLFDEIQGLSKKIDERPHVMPITLTVASQRASEKTPPYMKPIVIPPQEAAEEAPEPEGLPRYAEEPGETGQSLPETGLSDLQPEAEETESLSPIAAASELTDLDLEEDEPEKTETTLEEVPEEMREEEPETAEERPQEPPVSEAKAVNDVRRELRDYLNHVREKLETGPKTDRTPGDLLDYLENLSEYLPERQKRKFRASDVRLTIEMVKSRLAGNRGLREKITGSYRPLAPRKADPLTRPLLVDTFSYLKDLSAWHPDKNIGAAMRNKIDSLISRVGSAG
jgi:hypothetical protein